MKSGSYARWLLRGLGLGLALGGAAAMLRGWDIVQVERGWSLFIGGAAALSGGAVVIALAEVVARLDRLLAANAPVAETPAKRGPAPQPEQRAASASQPEPKAAPAPPLETSAPPAGLPENSPRPRPVAPAPTAPLAPPASLRVRREESPAPEPIARPRPQAAPPPVEADEPREIERYQSGELTYVMFSDGSVELRSETGAERFSSIEELRAMLATHE